MARKNFNHYQEFLNSVVRFWSQLGPDFSVGEWNQAEIEKEQSEFKLLNDQIFNLELELGSLRNLRDLKCKRIENFNSRLRSGVLAAFGTTSDQFLLLPRLMKAVAGRPNKAAETRKANTIQRKAALEAQKIADLVAQQLNQDSNAS